MRRYAEFFRAHRGWVAAFLVGVSSLALFGLLRLQFDDVPRGIFASDSEDYARLESVYRDFGADDNDVLFVLRRDPDHAAGWYDPDGVRILRALEAEVAAVEGVEQALGLGGMLTFDSGGGALAFLPRPLLPGEDASPEAFERARERAAEHPVVRGRLISDDGRTAVLLARLVRELIGVEDIAVPVAELRRIAAEASEDPSVTVQVTGVPSVRVDIYALLPREQVLFVSLGALICTLLALWIFRDPRAVVATMAGPVLGGFWTMGFCGLLGQKMDLLSTVLPELALVIGFTDSVHLMIDVRAARARGVDALTAATDSIRHLGLPCFLTSITTGVGFLSLLFADVPIIQRFGLLAAVAVSLTFLAVVTTLPLLVSWMPGVKGAKPRALIGGGWGGFVERVARRVVRAPGRVAIAGLVLSLACLWSATRLEPENRLSEALPRAGDAYLALEHAQEAFGGVLPAYVLLEWDPARAEGAPPATLDAMRAVRELLDGTEQVYAPLDAIDLASLVPGGVEDVVATLARMPEELTARLWRPDLGRALIPFQVPDGGADLTVGIFGALVEGLEGLSARFEGVDLHLTGTDFVARAQINRMILDLATSLGIAALVIFVVLAFEFRSLGLGLMSLQPNLFPLACVAAALVVFGHPLQMASAVLFTILLGIAVDDTIHLLARYRREGGREGGDGAIVRATAAVGEAIGFTTLVLFAGFGVVVFSAVPTNKLFAVMTCLGLLAALVGDLVLLPAWLALRMRWRTRWRLRRGD